MIEKTRILGAVTLLTFFIAGLKIWHVLLILAFNYTIYFIYDYFYQKTYDLFFKTYPHLSKYIK